jgi:peptide/nickel transport system ATP-binding protein
MLLEVKNLTISFQKEHEYKKVIRQLNFHLETDEILGIVGESGSGKSVSSLAILGLLPKRVAKIEDGEIIFEDEST